MRKKTRSAFELPFGILILLVFLAILFPSTSFSTWYWNHRAQIPTVSFSNGFWGDDAISRFFQWILDPLLMYGITIWNFLFRSDVIRLALPIVVGGILAAVGNDVYKSYTTRDNNKNSQKNA